MTEKEFNDKFKQAVEHTMDGRDCLKCKLICWPDQCALEGVPDRKKLFELLFSPVTDGTAAETVSGESRNPDDGK
jgi:hypothetical protein